ncbi:MAG: toprim domain-containing protein [Pseudomonadota bacterium]
MSFDRRAPEGFIVTSFAGDDWRECRDHVKRRLGIQDANLHLASRPRANLHEVQPPPIDGCSKTEAAQRIWQEAQPAIGSPVEAYLTGRGLELVPELSALRYHPRCPFKGEKVAAMVAPMTDAITGEFRGVHRTRLNPKDKAMLGPAKGAVVRLSPDHEVTDGLHICEGIETGLALLAMGFRPLWATLSATGMSQLPPLVGVECLTVFADHDANGVGELAARSVAARYRAAGREVNVYVAPEVGTDFADVRRAA